MKLVKPKVEIWEQPGGLQGMYRQIERVGKLSHLSEPKDSGSFIGMLKKLHHYSPFEAGTVYLFSPTRVIENLIEQPAERKENKWVNAALKYKSNPYSRVREGEFGGLEGLYVTTNYRVLVENGWENDLKWWIGKNKGHVDRICVKFITSRGIAMELLRHRSASFLQESQRYCNYTKDRFNGVTYVIPHWSKLKEAEYDCYLKVCKADINEQDRDFLFSLLYCEEYYARFILSGMKPQDAREVLPNACKAELAMTAFIDDWKHFFELRTSRATSGKPHPDMALLADKLYREFSERNYL